MQLKLTTCAIALALGASASAYGGLLVKDELTRENNRISANFRAEKQACDTRSGNAKDICMAIARGNEKVAKAELEARDKGTTKARQDALVAKADANYEVAKQRCDDLAGNPKDVCRADAQAALTRAKADAALDRKTADANATAADKVLEAQSLALNAKRDADYKAARERCNSLAGDPKDMCIKEARTRYGMP